MYDLIYTETAWLAADCGQITGHPEVHAQMTQYCAMWVRGFALAQVEGNAPYRVPPTISKLISADVRATFARWLRTAASEQSLCYIQGPKVGHGWRRKWTIYAEMWGNRASATHP